MIVGAACPIRLRKTDVLFGVRYLLTLASLRGFHHRLALSLHTCFELCELAFVEQFHSEIKTDMDVERLPSGKFATNELVLELTIIAYNSTRGGQKAL